MQVVGVVSDVRPVSASEQPSKNIYIPHAQDPGRSMYLIGRNTEDPSVLAGPIR